MAIVKMKRLRLIALAQDRDALLSSLLHVGCVELREPEGELAEENGAALLHHDSSCLADAKGDLTRLQHAIEVLDKYAPRKKPLLSLRPAMKEAELLDEAARRSVLDKADVINGHARTIGQLNARETRIHADRLSLQPWENCDIPLETKGTSKTEVLLGAVPVTADFGALTGALDEAAGAAEVRELSADREQRYLEILVHKDCRQGALDALRSFGFSFAQLKDLTGTAKDNIARLGRELDEISDQRSKEIEAIRQMSSCAGELKLGLDRVEQVIATESAKERLLTGGAILYLEGWASAPEIPELEKALAKFDCAYELEEPAEEEYPQVPVQLRNSKLVRPLNMVTEMYSLPAYDGIDPNPLIFPFFALFYGFMFADMGYGLVMFFAGWLLTRRFRPKGAMGNILQLAMVCGVTSFVCGALTGGFFGDLIPVVADVFLHKEVVLPSVISPLDDPMTVLVLGIVLGCVQLVVGQCVHIFMGFRDGEGVDALLDVVPWWIVFGGIALLALQGSAILLLLGVLALILTQGRHEQGFLKKLWGGISSLYDVTSWLSDVLSYSRLMALMLATTVIASVVNMLGTLPANLLVFIPIFLFGHTFNLGINLIGTYVHAARLQYLEFFGKFYKDGGRAFQPLRYQTNYVDVLNDAGEEVS